MLRLALPSMCAGCGCQHICLVSGPKTANHNLCDLLWLLHQPCYSNKSLPTQFCDDHGQVIWSMQLP